MDVDGFTKNIYKLKILEIMKIVYLKKFQFEMIDKGEMLNVIDDRGKNLSIVGGSETGAGEVCASEFSGSTNGTCVSYTSDWSEPGHLTTLYGTSDTGKPC
jgi:hypothetical protein